ncbi:MAG: helix-turn-helix domain-containing protein [Actinobacteria bacterium]|nr:helix-turn-helix domain-containing protein [Actinomycetota bacterium]
MFDLGTEKAEQGGVQTKGSVGTATSIYHTRLPSRRRLERMAKMVDLSKEARVRLTWIGHYKKYGNASVTARRFGISRSTLYKWVKRHIEKGGIFSING